MTLYFFLFDLAQLQARSHTAGVSISIFHFSSLLLLSASRGNSEEKKEKEDEAFWMARESKGGSTSVL